MAIVVAGTALALSTNFQRSAHAITLVGYDITSAVFDTYEAVYNREPEKIGKAAVDLTKSAVHAFDAAVFAVSIVIPIPVGKMWATIRRY